MTARLTTTAPGTWRRPLPPRPAAGFTLVESVIALTVMAIVTAALATMAKPALDAWTDTRHRAALTNEADVAVRRMVRDVQSAVPNSLRLTSSQCFELVPTIAGGRYRMADDTANPGTAAWVDPGAATTSFDVLSPLSTTPSVGDWVVVDNQNTASVYAAITDAESNRRAITAVSTPPVTAGRHRLTINAMQFPLGYDGGRFQVVPDAQQAVFYVCSGASTTLDSAGNAPGTLVRLKRYGFNATAPAACPAATGGDLVARHVRSCRFLYDPNQGATQQSGFISIQLELTRNNETVSLVVGAHVVNVP